MSAAKPRLLMTETARSALTAAATRAHPYETGGILIGVHADGHPWVTDVLEIPTTDRGHSHYRIPAAATQAAVLNARTLDRRLGYLGDWHSHPRDIGPSRTDIATLAATSLRHPREPNPTQIVVRRTDHGYVLDARRFVGLTHRICAVGLTGNLAQTRPAGSDGDPGAPSPRDPLPPPPGACP